MTIDELIRMAENKLRALSDQKNEFSRIGDVERVLSTENDIAQTQATLNQLRTLN